MVRYFTHYWKSTTVDSPVEIEGRPITHLGSKMFAQRGVSPGDEIYAVTMRRGALFLLGKMVVDLLTGDAEEAAATLSVSINEIWGMDDHLVAASATPLRKNCLVPSVITAGLRFLSNGQ